MWITEWRAISAQIAALIDTGAFFFKTNDNGNYGTDDVLIRNADACTFKLQQFLSLHGAQIPKGPRDWLDVFVKTYKERFGGEDEDNPFGSPRGPSGVMAVLTALALFRSEFEYLVADTEAIARSLVVRAFAHLRRSIVADDSVNRRWRQAFKKGEPACESLGACHLLTHGIWAFKTSATGERTDLVLGEPFDKDEAQRASQGLILTEWKCVRNEGELTKKAQEAYAQAQLYSEGILAGFEVASRRYLVLVSRDRLVVPRPKRVGEVTYECHNIATAPRTPSQTARKTRHRDGTVDEGWES